MKTLHTFTISRKKETEIVEETKDGKLVKKELIDVPYEIVIKRPSRVEVEDASDFYAINYANFVRKGLLTKALIEKLYGNENGFLSEPDKNRYFAAYVKLFEIQNQYTELDLKSDKTAEEKAKLESFGGEFAKAKRELQTLEAANNAIFENTAENKAIDKQIMWYTFYLTYFKEGDKYTPIFTGEDLDERLAKYDEIMESENDESDFYRKIIDKAGFFISLLVLNKISTPEEFKEIEQEIDRSTAT